MATGMGINNKYQYDMSKRKFSLLGTEQDAKITANHRWTKHLDRQVALQKGSPFLRAASSEYAPLPESDGKPPPPPPAEEAHQRLPRRSVSSQPPIVRDAGVRKQPPRRRGHLPCSSTPKTMPKSRDCNGEASNGGEWGRNGSFINKPARGWLHSDKKILNEGVIYEVRYVGCLEVNTSMKVLDFDMRSLVAKECINRICEFACLKTPDKKRKVDRKVMKMLSEFPNMEHAGENIHLIITSASLELRVMESGDIIAVHDMPNISFASGGDADTLDFVAYVAKDMSGKRACHVLECGGKLAQDVIATIGQAFELRFKEYLQKTSRHHTGAERREDAPDHHWLEPVVKDDPEYYNDLPGKVPPEVNSAASSLPPSYHQASSSDVKGEPHCHSLASQQGCPKDLSPNLIDLNSEPTSPDPFLRKSSPEYANDACNTATLPLSGATLLDSYSPKELVAPTDPFDMQPFEASLPPPTNVTQLSSARTAQGTTPKSLNMLRELEREEWYHGAISRRDAELLLRKDGEFLVRESQGSPGQYVLTGMHAGFKKHLLLADPEGVVRTKDKTFESVSHLVNYHRNKGLPIISAESALILRYPVPKRH